MDVGDGLVVVDEVDDFVVDVDKSLLLSFFDEISGKKLYPFSVLPLIKLIADCVVVMVDGLVAVDGFLVVDVLIFVDVLVVVDGLVLVEEVDGFVVVDVTDGLEVERIVGCLVVIDKSLFFSFAKEFSVAGSNKS